MDLHQHDIGPEPPSLTDLAFNQLDTAEDRLRTLTTLDVLDRFRPRCDWSTRPAPRRAATNAGCMTRGPDLLASVSTLLMGSGPRQCQD